ncbi:hypothetical protein [Actinoplanes sp. NPDC023714]|uniref:hypothetical protein n=1 Tax=Actinoplanes sp. NPDC023714 TaxID=3154322 RepID=UPI0034004801
MDAAALLRRPAFWAAHLGVACGAALDEDLAALFGAGLGLIRGTYLRLTDDAAEPVLPAGAGLAVVYRNDDQIVDYLLHPPGAAPITLAEADGVPDGPALSWPELSGLAARAPDPVGRAHTLLLLAPVLGDTAAASAPSGDPAAALSAALRTAGVTGDTPAIAALLVAARPATWRTEDGVRICDHPGSTRNPDGPRALSPEQRATVSALLTPPR